MSAPTPAWGPGPWDDDPDREQWFGPGRLPCLIARTAAGTVCGYVGVGRQHPLHGAEDYDVQVTLALTHADLPEITWADGKLPAGEVTEAGWWIGFHGLTYGGYGALIPQCPTVETYQPFAVVRPRVERLADALHQLATYATARPPKEPAVPESRTPVGREGQLDSRGARVGRVRAATEVADEKVARTLTGRCTLLCGDMRCPAACHET